MKVICVSGYYDPICPGHIELMQRAKALYPGSKLIVIVNNDNQAALKKGRAFMPATQRLKVVQALGCVDAAIISCDTDRTVRETLRLIRPDVFANGGDVTPDNPCAEEEVCRELGIELVYGLGEKITSSRWLLEAAGFPKY